MALCRTKGSHKAACPSQCPQRRWGPLGDEGAGAAQPSYPLPSTTGRAGANRTNHSPTSSQETTPLGGGLVGLCEVRPSRSHELYNFIDSERIFYPSDDSLLPGPWSTGTEGGRAPGPGRGGAVLASPVPNNPDIDIFAGGTPADETIASLF